MHKVIYPLILNVSRFWTWCGCPKCTLGALRTYVRSPLLARFAPDLMIAHVMIWYNVQAKYRQVRDEHVIHDLLMNLKKRLKDRSSLEYFELSDIVGRINGISLVSERRSVVWQKICLNEVILLFILSYFLFCKRCRDFFYSSCDSALISIVCLRRGYSTLLRKLKCRKLVEDGLISQHAGYGVISLAWIESYHLNVGVEGNLVF